jgi:hypothetical protein
MYPSYHFRPVHNKSKEKKPKTLIPPDDERRCEDVARLLLEGMKGAELAAAVERLDRVRSATPINLAPLPYPSNQLHYSLGSHDLRDFRYSSNAYLPQASNPRQSMMDRPLGPRPPADKRNSTYESAFGRPSVSHHTSGPSTPQNYPPPRSHPPNQQHYSPSSHDLPNSPLLSDAYLPQTPNPRQSHDAPSPPQSQVSVLCLVSTMFTVL